MSDQTTTSRYRVVKSYRSSNADPIILRKGDTVHVGQDYDGDPEWKDWLWCESNADKGGWVPRSLMTILGSTGTAREDYSARELSIQKGETLNVIAILNGWAWSRRTNGESGWVPLRNLEPHPVSKS
jgi:hypothetical protein